MAITTTAPRPRLCPPPRMLGDERLARLAAQGDREALAAIFERHHQALYRYCRMVVGNGEDAQDALQNAMARMVRALPGETREVALKAWLYRLAHNEAMRIVERRRPQTALEDAGELAAPDAQDGVVARERLAALLGDLRELSGRQRGALVLRELEGASFAQVAEVFGGSEAAARQTVHEARLCLADFERGRAMTCDEVTRALSDGDRRRLRGRGVRAHLRACEECRAFEEALRRRPRELAALAPPLAAPLAAGLLGKILGGGTSAGGGLGGTAAGAGTVAGLVPAVALKGLAGLAVTAGVVVGAPQVVGGLDEVGGALAGIVTGEGGQPPAQRSTSEARTAASGGPPLAGGPGRAGGRSRDGGRASGQQPRGAQAASGAEPEGPGRDNVSARSPAALPGDAREDAPRSEPGPSASPDRDVPAARRPGRELPGQAPAAGRGPDNARPSRPATPAPVSPPAPAVTIPAPGVPSLPGPVPPGVPDVRNAPSAVVRR